MKSPYLRSTAAQPVPSHVPCKSIPPSCSPVNSRAVPTLWAFLMIPRPLAELDYPSQTSFFFFLPLLCTLRLCPCQWGHCPCLFCPQHISHKTFSEQNQKFIPTFFKDEETKRRRIPQSHTKSSTNISQTCSTSRVLLNWSWVHLGFWCQGRVAHTLHQSLLQHGESLDTLAPWARKSSPS